MKYKFTKIIITLLGILLLVYLSFPSPEFPAPLPDSVQSDEPADVESPFRRGYYTNLNREEVINHYQNEFKNVYGVYTLRLNYPPEEAQTLIRDQTKSSYLEELAHPLRESIYINGFVPKTVEYALFFDDKEWSQKVIVRYIPSLVWIRIIVLVLTLAVSLALVREYKYAKNT